MPIARHTDITAPDMNTELARIEVEGAQFSLLERQATYLAQTSIIPKAFRGDEAAIIVVGMMGQTLGMPLMEAINSIILVEGNLTLKAQTMRSLVWAAGFSLSLEGDSEKATAVGERTDRAGKPHAETVVFSMADAETAGLAKRSTWKQYPRAMLKARATSELCRDFFPDVLRGMSYTPEEVSNIDNSYTPARAPSGAGTVTSEGDVVDVDVVDPVAELPASATEVTDKPKRERAPVDAEPFPTTAPEIEASETDMVKMSEIRGLLELLGLKPEQVARQTKKYYKQANWWELPEEHLDDLIGKLTKAVATQEAKVAPTEAEA